MIFLFVISMVIFLSVISMYLLRSLEVYLVTSIILKLPASKFLPFFITFLENTSKALTYCVADFHNTNSAIYRPNALYSLHIIVKVLFSYLLVNCQLIFGSLIFNILAHVQKVIILLHYGLYKS